MHIRAPHNVTQLPGSVTVGLAAFARLSEVGSVTFEYLRVQVGPGGGQPPTAPTQLGSKGQEVQPFGAGDQNQKVHASASGAARTSALFRTWERLIDNQSADVEADESHAWQEAMEEVRTLLGNAVYLT